MGDFAQTTCTRCGLFVGGIGLENSETLKSAIKKCDGAKSGEQRINFEEDCLFYKVWK